MMLCCAAVLLAAQQRRPAPPPDPEPEEEGVEPEYTFNPIQARKEMKVGDFYFKKGSFRAAALRYERATKWEPGLAEAYYKLGEAREKLDEPALALAAYQKYLELAPTAGRKPAVQKKITELERKTAKPDDQRPRSPAPNARPPTPNPRPPTPDP